MNSLLVNDDVSVDAVLKTLLLTDLVDSTRLVETLGDARAYKVATRHDRAARDLLPRFGGQEINKTDGFLLLFERPIDAVGYALAYHQALARLSDELGVALRARAGIHLGEIRLRRNSPEDVALGAQRLEVEGIAKPTAARVMSLARGRQTLLTRAAFELARRAAVGKDLAGDEVSWIYHGLYRFKGVEEPVEICEVGRVDAAPLAAPLSSEKALRLAERSEGEPQTAARLGLTASGGQRRRRRRNPFYHRQGITDPSQFFGRADLVRSLLEMVASGQSCAVVGERRMGKSSLLAFLAHPQIQADHHLDPERTLSVVLDFLALHTSTRDELVGEILEALEMATRQSEALDVLRRAAEPTFSELRRVLRRLDRLGFRVVFFCDEFELAVRNPEFDQSFFGALRSLAGGGAVFVTASRLSLLELEQYQSEEVRQKVLGSPFFNIFAEFQVEPFHDHEVAEMLATLLEPMPIRFEREDVAFVDRLAGRHPYFLQLTAYHLYGAIERARRASNVDLLNQATVAREEVRDQVRREAAKIFRNQWDHCLRDEQRVLAALALAASSDGRRSIRVGGVEERTLRRLERRGLVRRRVEAGERRTEAGGSGLLRDYRIFSDLLPDWILNHVTSTLDGETSFEVAELELLPATSAPTSAAARYKILEEIGRGGSGTVYKARDEHLERVVAVKVLDPEIRSSPEHLKRLLDEARTCAGLHHPHIVVIHDIDMEHAHLVQEFLAGGSLRDLLEEIPVLGSEDVLALAEQLVSALGAAHRAGVVHRDLKPENVLLTSRPARRPDGRGTILPTVKLSDFGAAVSLGDLSQSQERRSVAGTLAYMAPEQMLGEGVGPAADVYSLGVVLYEARNGERPPPAGSRQAAGDRTGEDEATLDGVIRRCLAVKPRERYQGTEEVRSALEGVRQAPGKGELS